MKTFNTETYSRLAAIAQSIQTGNNADTITLIDALIEFKTQEKKPAWIREMTKLRTVILTGQAAYEIFKLDGNSKLPFAAFSSLPGVTCPGAGECLNWCYSFKAWRYPAAFARMAQNAWLMRRNRPAIAQAFQTLPESMTLRLYIDGDFASGTDIVFWMDQLKSRPDVQAYGYSKSFNQLLHHDVTLKCTGDTWPTNYILNLSGGHNHSRMVVAAMQNLPITRGTFDAVSIGRKVKSSDHGKPETNRAIRAQAGKVFPCPGKCGSCTPKGHACGSDRFRNIPIVIAVH